MILRSSPIVTACVRSFAASFLRPQPCRPPRHRAILPPPRRYSRRIGSPLRARRRRRRGRDTAPRRAARRRAPRLPRSPRRLFGRSRDPTPRLRVGAGAALRRPQLRCRHLPGSAGTSRRPRGSRARDGARGAPRRGGIRALRTFFPHRQRAARQTPRPPGQSPRACATLESPHLSHLPFGVGGRGADHRGLSLDHRVLPSKPTLIFLLLAAIGVARIAATYRSIAQTSDETPNIACGMQYLDLGRYDYGAFHPPLARLAIAIGPYLYGARAQKLPDRWKEGNAVLNSAPRYGKALTLARLGILPFFLLACTMVWLWGRKLLGDWGALAPVFLFTNIPPVLAHAGVATMDMAAGAGICTALFTCTLWLEEGTLRRAIFLGIRLAVAVLAQFSAVLLRSE